jgi:hypothetical protein
MKEEDIPFSAQVRGLEIQNQACGESLQALFLNK